MDGDAAANAWKDLPFRLRRPRKEKGRTSFGNVFHGYRGQYSFFNQDLVGEGEGFLTPSQTQQLSRMCTNADAILGMSPDRCEKLVSAIAKAIYRWIEESDTLKPPPGVETRIKERLLAAVEADRATAARQPLAASIGLKLMERTNRSLADLEFVLGDPDVEVVFHRVSRSGRSERR